jgi:hypothetical protein
VEGVMKMILTALAFGVLFALPASTQTITVPNGIPTMKPKEVKVSSIRRVTKDGGVKHKPRIEIEVASSDPFYVGAMEWSLRIGEHCSQWPLRKLPEARLLVYGLTAGQWDNLKDGDPMYITYGGCPDTSNKSISPFAYLNKKMRRKKPAVKG